MWRVVPFWDLICGVILFRTCPRFARSTGCARCAAPNLSEEVRASTRRTRNKTNLVTEPDPIGTLCCSLSCAPQGDLQFFENCPGGEKGLRERLKNVLQNDFVRMTYTELVDLVRRDAKEGKVCDVVFWLRRHRTASYIMPTLSLAKASFECATDSSAAAMTRSA